MFKKDFIWGVATASYQIEGAAYEDGKGLSIWDEFCKVPGKVRDFHSGDIACDHYHRYKEDVALMKEMGVKNYRLSISWPRLLPEGIGKVNEKGVQFYHNLFDELIKNGITPYVTLFHWDYPKALFDKGGWLNPESSKWFEEYALLIAKEYGSKIKYFMTFNEPQCFIGKSYIGDCKHAPGLRMPISDVIKMIHNMLKGHGLAVKALRENCNSDVKIGYAPTGSLYYPFNEENSADVNAAYEMTFKTSESEKFGFDLSWYVDPVVFGTYPEDGLKMYEKYLPSNWKEDMGIICQPLDFMGQNNYNGQSVRVNGSDVEFLKRKVGHPRTAINWPVTPESIKWVVKFLHQRYKLPVLITENGLSCTDVVSLDGKVHDPNRIDFYHRYLLKLQEAIDEGADVMGYFAWSFMDNFEWSEGYNERFGLVYVDFETQERTVKDSGYWYKKVIETNGECL